MKILRNYILKECVPPFFISLTVLTTVFLLGYLPRLADQVINKGVSISAISQVFLCYIPYLLAYTIPIAALAGVILTMGRLSADNEVIALRASGIHLSRVIKPFIFLGVILSLVLFILNATVIPKAYHQQRKLLYDTGTKNPYALLEAGTFIDDFEGQIIFIYKIEKNRLYNVRIYQPQGEGKPTRTIIAQEGEFTRVPGEEKIMLKLMNGTSDEPDFDDPNNFFKLNFKNSFIVLDASQKNNNIDKKPKGMTMPELKKRIQELEKLMIDPLPLITEYHRRITWSMTPFLFILLGFPIALITHRRERTANALFAFLFAAPYFLISLGFQAMASKGFMPADIAMWIPNIIALIIVSILNIKLCAS